MSQKNLSSNTLYVLTASHIVLLIISNLLVQYPFRLFGFHTTWGAFSYPAIFILTDLTVRLSNARYARTVIFRCMIPGLILSYLIASYIEASNGLESTLIHIMPLRIACACCVAYVVGQVLDVTVFQRYRNQSGWWIAPILSSTVGNIVDTVLFFVIAFYHCSNPFLSQHWPEIASMDLLFKLVISWFTFIPLYGLILNLIGLNSLKKRVT
jgi:queuosine precursor transporter